MILKGTMSILNDCGLFVSLVTKYQLYYHQFDGTGIKKSEICKGEKEDIIVFCTY